MKKGKYSKREIKKFMTAGIIISAVELLIMVLVFAGQIQSIIFKVFCIIICGALWAGWTAAFYEKIYKPNLELEALIEEYSGKAEYTSGDEAVKGDMIQEIKEIIRFLDTIAVKQKNAEILMKNAEINNLQDQINPHFLYNTLEVIRGEALAVGEKRIAEMTASLANYFRYNISRKEAFVFLKDELKNIRNYFNIQKNRFGKKSPLKFYIMVLRKRKSDFAIFRS